MAQEIGAYPKLDQISSASSDKNTSKQPQDQIVHLQARDPVGGSDADNDKQWASSGNKWDCPCRDCVAAMEWIAVPPVFLPPME